MLLLWRPAGVALSLVLLRAKLPKPRRAPAAAPAPRAPWVGAFFSQYDKEALSSRFGELASASSCDHMTIAHSPNATTLAMLEPLFGTAAVVSVLGVAADANGRAALVRVDGPASANDFPHVTLKVGAWPYTAAYSNCLWERVVAAAGATVDRDAAGQPVGVALPGGAQQWRGALPAGRCAGSPKFHVATAATLDISDGGAAEYHTTLCLNTRWDRSAGVCRCAGEDSPLL
ncbi:hypothetical protein M885DRAFT_504212 [Pelagophyceae sp. CCMP2097]|nr:hypothetical protein M885DRAFT_504212 [Pelagophyceae sp. CCMP2097]